MILYRMAAVCIAAALSCSTIAQTKDIINTKSDSSQEQNSSIFLNAASDSKPREISLGLPTNASSAVQIFEDGMPVSYYIYQMFPYKSWHGGVSAKTTGTMGPMETALRYGEINNYVDSYNKTGSDVLKGTLSYTLGSWGQHKFDLNLTGPLGRGWGYSVSTYQNFDPGSNHNISPMLKDRHQFYKGVISKTFADGRGETSLTYQFVNYLSVQENYGPFVFVGDGSVKAYEGFNLGFDSYRPDFGSFTFMDMKTGKIERMNIPDGNRDVTHHLTYSLKYSLTSGGHVEFRSRFKTGEGLRGAGSLAGIEQVKAGGAYTYENGEPFSGYLQKRNILHFDTFDTSWLNNAEITLPKGNHILRLGADYAFNHGGTITSSVAFSHEVAPAPRLILRSGESFYNYNTAGEYYDGYENKAALYLKDEWVIRRGFEVSAFARVEGLSIHGEAANNIGSDTSNSRYSGFNLTKGKITTFSENYLNGSAGASVNYSVAGGLSLLGEAIFTRIHGNIFNYGGFYDPSTKPTDTKFARAGISYKNAWVNLTSQINFISQSNYNTRSVFQHTLQREVAGYPAGYIETITLPVSYGISSLGWVTDAQLTFQDGFTLHANFTIREPKYKDFEFRPSFSDGVTEEYDFSGNNVTNLHKIELTLDPSYSTGDWRFWLSTRYISKTYINKTNSLFFKGRIETFGGIDLKMSDKCKLSLNVINLLNQKGASGLISSADLVEDASGYKNYVMAGTFIRPFTVELGVTMNF